MKHHANHPLRLIALFTLTLSIFWSSCTLDGDIFGPVESNCISATGGLATKAFEPGAFSRINIPQEWDNVTITKGSRYEVEVDAPAGVLEVMDVRTNGDDLHFELSECFTFTPKLTVRITLPELRSLTNHAFSSKIQIRDFNSPQQDLEIKCPDPATITALNVTYKKISGDLNNVNLTLSGNCTELNMYLYSGSRLEAYGLEAQKASINSNSILDAKVKVNEELKAQINDSGNIRYKGHPQVAADINGTGQVIDEN